MAEISESTVEEAVTTEAEEVNNVDAVVEEKKEVLVTKEEVDNVEADVEEKKEVIEVTNSEKPSNANKVEKNVEDETAIAEAGDDDGAEPSEVEEGIKDTSDELPETEEAADENGDNDGFLVLEEDDMDDSIEMDADEADEDGVNGDTAEGTADETMEEANMMKGEVAETDEQQVLDSDCCNHASENVMLRSAVLELSERLGLLEEFIEVEYEERFGKFLKNRERLVDIMGLGGPQDVTTTPVDGKRNSKSSELVGLLKVIKAQASTSNSDKSRGTRIPTSTSSNQPRKDGSSSSRGGNTRNRDFKSNQNSSPSKSNSHQSPRAGGSITLPSKGDSHSSSAKNLKACKCCFLTDHLLAQCPYRGKRPFEIRKEIQKRKQTYYDSDRGSSSSITKVRRT
ncbi:unnamed protein product [Orchesella dallaii]|uniref:Uncharacterized protein n=1 Tax=Orchesella dallaii TaxID=48710 RepID=A0ABP1RB25_9HEXA